MTIAAGICGATTVVGFYEMLSAFVLLLVLASFIKNDSNQLYAIRRVISQRMSPWLGWFPGALFGGATAIVLHLYDVFLLKLNRGQIELPIWLLAVITLYALIGAMSQVIITGMVAGFFRWRANSNNTNQRTMT